MSNKNPKVSIIVPIYNLEKYISRCMESIINQTLKNVEIICINDGSIDRSLDIIRRHEAKDQRIRVVDKINEGQGIARNIGIKMAAGEYVGFVDGDDSVDLIMYEKMYECASRNISDIHICSVNKVDSNGKELKLRCDYDLYFGKKFSSDSVVLPPQEVLDAVFKTSRYAWNKIYKRSFLNANSILFSKSKYYQDHLFHVAAFLHARRISYSRESFYNYTVSRKDATSTRKDKPFTLFDVNNEILEYLASQKVDRAFHGKYLNSLLRRHIVCYFNIDAEYRSKYCEMMKAELATYDIKNADIEMIEKIFYFMVSHLPCRFVCGLHSMGRALFSIRHAIRRTP